MGEVKTPHSAPPPKYRELWVSECTPVGGVDIQHTKYELCHLDRGNCNNVPKGRMPSDSVEADRGYMQ